MHIVSRREEKGKGPDQGDQPFHSKHPSSRSGGVRGTLRHSSSVDALRSGQGYWEKRLQLRHSCTGEDHTAW
ncbi:hypothetical protein EYF80_064653 [Liparis tanakae]|uniref:Uncharacterized protein n=1 Tax=Liparis tanakae TaxID=230148 RepID=A0A4Z2E8V7_9TELE|nr:hypothetical protein EYF80_064653 [Liparis tanakae]